tara:strand:+ start:645 stop:935 length:291 start_codon:yes stop_codon:yes gene_type:complete
MRLMAILSAIVLLSIMTLPAKAGHSTGNGTCLDDATHYQNMIVNGKRSDAPLYQQSLEMRDKAVAEKTQGNVDKCEEYFEEALRMIRKTGGEYPTE